jgi:hypothetical protein
MHVGKVPLIAMGGNRVRDWSCPGRGRGMK